jgi:prepilin-type processing-associated H-X9-DG protein
VGDYAASIGTTGFDYTVVYPDSFPIPPNGVFRAAKGIRMADILDGLSNTLLVGEKHVRRGSETLHPWDCGIYDGHNVSCCTRAAGPAFPLARTANDPGWRFGSRHPGLCQFALCDGSVRTLASSLDPVILGLLAQCNDGVVIPEF